MRALLLLLVGCQAASLEGRVVFHGPPPERAAFELDEAMAEIHGSDVYVDELWLVGPEGGVQNAVVLLEGDATVEAGQGARFDKVGAVYEPRILIVPVGTEVTFENTNSVCRGFISKSIRNSGFNMNLGIGMPRTRSFEHPEAIPIYCSQREYMRGGIVVVDTPYYRLTGPDGRFRFNDVPAGTYRLRVWHEGTGWVRGLGRVEVGSGSKVEVTLDLPE